MRPGEKLFEELQYGGESIDKTRHPKIYIGKIAGVPPDDLAAALGRLRELASAGSDRRHPGVPGLVPARGAARRGRAAVSLMSPQGTHVYIPECLDQACGWLSFESGT
jgi:hypothetical protein